MLLHGTSKYIRSHPKDRHPRPTGWIWTRNVRIIRSLRCCSINHIFKSKVTIHRRRAGIGLRSALEERIVTFYLWICSLPLCHMQANCPILGSLSINTANPELPMLPWTLNINRNVHFRLANAVTQISVAVSERRWQSNTVATDFSYENRNFLMLHILKT